MRYTLASLTILSMLGLAALTAQTKTPPAKLVFKAKTGDVTFNHAAHLKREKDNCKVCHETLFKQDAKAPLNYKPLHKAAEDKKISCGACHRPGGTAFETKGNCANSKCHVRAAAK
jgi:c(7)-type cytochrome triheme protein